MSKHAVIFTGLILFVSCAFGQHQTYGHSAGNRPFLMPVDPVEILGEMESPGFFENRDAYYGARRHESKDNVPVFTPSNRSLGVREQAALQAIIEDFQVNENAGPNGAGQYYPAIAMDGAGNFVVVWTDYRNGDGDIYAQRYAADGMAVGTNFKVNDDVGSTDQSFPAIAVDDAGNFAVVWADERNGGWDIYAQRYAADGSALGANFKVTKGIRLSYPAIAMDGAGNFMIVWLDNRNIHSDVYAQLYAADGKAVGANFKVNEESGVSNPAITMDGAGNFVIVWQGNYNKYSGEFYNIYAQRYAADGSAVGVNFKVNDDEGHPKYFPAIAADEEGNFMVVWKDSRNNYLGDIYGQRYTADGRAAGTNIKINEEVGTQYYQTSSPAIAADGAGNFVIVWTDERNGVEDIYAQRYAADGKAVGSNFKVNEGSEGSQPAIATDSAGNFVVVWEDTRDMSLDIYAQRYVSNGAAVGANFKVNDDYGSADQWDPAIAIDGAGNFVVVWEDRRNGDYDIYGQRYAADGTAVGPNFRVNDDARGSYQYNPAIAVNGVGNFVVVWEDLRTGDYDIYGQRYAVDGSPVDSNFVVTKTTKYLQFTPDVKLWQDRIYTTWLTEDALATYSSIWANVLDWNHPFGNENEAESVVKAFQLFQNYPNPFNSTTTIKYALPKESMVKLEVFNALGQKVATLVNSRKPARYHEVTFNGSGLPSGVYYYQLKTDKGFVQAKKLVLLK